MSFPINRPKFFKVIIKPEANNLVIPTEFTKKHGREFNDHVFLIVPSGKLWEIELVKSDDEILLEKGWEKFRDHYSVEFGYFLVFVYDGDSRFSVFVFDRTSTEIEYPFDDNDNEVGSESDGNGKRLEVVPCQEENDGLLEKELKTQEVTEKSADKMKIVGEGTENDKGKDNFADQEGGSSHTGTSCKFTNELTLYTAHKLKIHKEFVECTGIRPHRRIILQNVKGEEWLVNIIGEKHSDTALAFSSGWNKFLIDNKIVVGSTMSFEFISSSKLLARVVKTGPNEKELFDDMRRKGGKYMIVSSHDRVNRKPDNVARTIKENDDDQIEQKENDFGVGSNLNSSHKMKMHRRSYKLDLANGLAKGTSEKCTEIDNLFHDNDKDDGSESDASDVILEENCKTKKCKGKRLAVVSRQGANDEFVRKRLKTEESAEKTKVDASAEEMQNDVILNDKITENGKGKNVITDKEGGSSHIGTSLTFTKQVMMSRAYKLEIPKEFEKCTGLRVHEQITLQNMEGVEWPVSIVGRTSSKGLLALCRGWNKFLVDNNVIIGSTISLKFIASSKFQFQVVKPGPNKTKIFGNVKRRGGKFVVIASLDRVMRKSKNVPRTIKSVNHDNYQISKEEENGSGVGSNLNVSHIMKTRRQEKLDFLNGYAKKIRNSDN